MPQPAPGFASERSPQTRRRGHWLGEQFGHQPEHRRRTISTSIGLKAPLLEFSAEQAVKAHTMSMSARSSKGSHPVHCRVPDARSVRSIPLADLSLDFKQDTLAFPSTWRCRQRSQMAVGHRADGHGCAVRRAPVTQRVAAAARCCQSACTPGFTCRATSARSR